MGAATGSDSLRYGIATATMVAPTTPEGTNGQVTDGTWEEFMRQRLFEPLEMTGSNLSVTTS